MHLRRTTQRWITSLALVVVTFAALAPALANAFGLNNMGPMAWIELCSGQGTKRIAVDSAGEPIVSVGASEPIERAAHASEHCPFCHIELAATSLPPALAPVVPQDLSHDEFPALFYAASRPRFAWAAARSRAPPTRS